MSEHADEYVTVAMAAELANIPARTLRHWVEDGRLPAMAGPRGRLVRVRDVQAIAVAAGRSGGKDGQTMAKADWPAMAGQVADDMATGAETAAMAGQMATDGQQRPEVAMTGALAMQHLVQQIVAPLAEANERQAAALERTQRELGDAREALGRERALREAAETRLAATERAARPRRPLWLRLILGR